MFKYRIVSLRKRNDLKEKSTKWFHNKCGIPYEAYLKCIDDYILKKTENGWYMCLDGEKIVAGIGVVDNDFHNRLDLSPNVCALYVEKEYRCQGIAGKLLNAIILDCKSNDMKNLYLLIDHNGFCEKYGW